MTYKTYNTLFYILIYTILAISLAPADVFAGSFFVDTTDDTTDLVPGDGICADASGNCTLRAAVMEANATPGADTITMGAGTFTLSIPGNAEHAAVTGDLDIRGPVTIQGAGPGLTIIDGGGIDRVFEIIDGSNVTISRLTVQNGVAGRNIPGFFVNFVGGGIFNIGNTSSATLSEVEVRNNSARSGGGVFSMFSSMAIYNSTVHDNVATAGSGGGIAEGLAGYMRVYNSTISGNSATINGGGIVTSNNVAWYSNVTVVNNTADSDNNGSGNGGGIAQGITAPRLLNSILAMNIDTGGENPDCSGSVVSSGYNVIGNDTGCTVTANTGDQIGNGASPLDPLLAPLADNGGPTLTHALLNGSPALDNGNPATPGSGGSSCLANDQRGIDRTGTVPCDIGAFEYAPSQGLSFTVNSTLDRVDANIGDGQCETVPGNNECTLRAAIQETNALIGDNRVILPAGNYILNIAGSNEDLAATGDLDILDNLELVGSGSASTVIDANGIDRVFHTRFANYFTLSGATLQNGNVTDDGGGIRHSARALIVSDCVINNNTAGGSGGGLFTVAFKSMTISDCVISNNSAGFYGGGISNFTFATLVLTNSTLSGNTAATGGGLMNSFMSNATLTGSTISDNTAQFGGGIGTLFGSGVVTLRNSTVSGNRASVSGGGINVSANDIVNLRNVTVTANRATALADGGGIAGSGTVNLRNSVIAGNIDTGGEAPDCSGTLFSQGYNLLGDNTACTFTATTGDQVGDALGPIDPLLGPLADNGGTTRTHILVPGSPLLNAANAALPGSGGSACEGNDQRGTNRLLGVPCDIGAVETIFADLDISMSGSLLPVLPGSTTDYAITLTNIGPDTAYNIVLADTLPGGAAYVSASGTGWTCTGSGTLVTCTLASLTAGATSRLTLSIQMPLTPATVSNSASVSTDSIDPDPANNTASAVTRVNAAPVVITSADANYTLGDSPVAVAVDASVTDPDDSVLEGAIVFFSSGYLPDQDELRFTDTANITASWNVATGVLTLTGSDTVDAWQAALRNVQYVNIGNEAVTGTRALGYRVNDGLSDSATATSLLSVNQPHSGLFMPPGSSPPADPGTGDIPDEPAPDGPEENPVTGDTPATDTETTAQPQREAQQPQTNKQQSTTPRPAQNAYQNSPPAGNRGRAIITTGSMAERTLAYRKVMAENANLWEQLDAMKQEMNQAVEEENEQEKIILGAAKSVTLVLFAGIVNWFMKAGTLLTSLLSSMPLWTPFDPLPILSLSRKERARQRDKAEQSKQQDDHDLGRMSTLFDKGQDTVTSPEVPE